MKTSFLLSIAVRGTLALHGATEASAMFLQLVVLIWGKLSFHPLGQKLLNKLGVVAHTPLISAVRR